MAENPIKHSDIIEIDKTIQGIKTIIKELKVLQKTMQDTAKGMITFQKAQNINTPGGRAATKQQTAEIEKLVSTKKKLITTERELTKDVVRLREQRRKLNTELKQEIQLEQSIPGSVARMRAEYNKLNQAYINGSGSIRSKLRPQMQKLDAQIKKNEQAIGKHQRSVGNYGKVFDKAKGALLAFGAGVVGATALIGGMSRAIKNSISIVLSFDQAMADVAAITRASVGEVGMLRNAAKALGGTTKFTATEVARLQKELGKLGFTVSETLTATGGILALAAAMDEDLARSAEVAGAAVRAFGLDASETQRVVDVMARSFTLTPLNIERFSVSMRSAATTAKIFGFSIEETTALLGSLVKVGLDASMAGTATRNILLNLADANGALAKELGRTVTSFDDFIPALIEARERGIDLGAALELTDKRSVNAFLTFLDGAESLRDLTTELRNAGGAAETMAEIQLNTLQGDLTILKSAFQGLVIQVSDTNTGMNDTARGGVTLLTKGLVALKDEAEETDTWLDKIRKTVLRLVAPTGLPALIELLKLGKGGMEEFGTATKEVADQTRILTWEQRQQLNLEEQKKAVEEAEIKRKERLLELVIQRRALLEFQLAADKKLIESQNTQQKETGNFMALLEELRTSEEAFDNQELAQGEFLLQQDQKRTDQAIKNLNDKNKAEKESATTSQKISLGNSIVALAQGFANTAKAGFPINIPLLIGYFAQVAGIIGTITSVKFEKGGHGVLDGPSHSQGGIQIPGAGEAQGKEYYGIINQQMTRKYSGDLPGIFDSLNSGKFHDVWSNANIQLQTQVDPWTKKMYDQMMKTPTVYTDSNGDQVLKYPDGYTQVIRR